jgi:histidine triad (HIT) family protein
MSDCIFCDIADDKAPASFVYQDNITLAFMDISSLNSGQVVVIPRKHLPRLTDMDEATGKELFATAMRVCRAIYASTIPCDGINLLLADGTAAAQEVFHMHFLIIPRLKGDSMKIKGRWTPPTRPKMDALAAEIRRSIETP